MSDSDKSYRKVDNFYKESKSTPSFGKNVVVPFVSGVLGAILVVGTCFGVPQIKNSLLKSEVATSTKANVANTSSATSQVSLSNYEDTSIAVANKILPSIVGIEIKYNVNSVFGGKSGSAEASGSGIIISQDGYILTNNHVVDSSSTNSSSNNSFYQISEATQINVYLYNDSTAYPATIVGQDELTDIAVIKIDKSDLAAAELGDSDQVQVGAFAMAVGNPLGLQSSITCGNISAVNRELTDSDGKSGKYLQTDAAINSGNSGGALVNSNGQVIGINTLKLSATGVEGMGFAIPINSVKDVYQQLIQYNKVKRPYIGLTGVDVDEQTSKYYNIPVGIYVKSVENFSPAEKAGFKAGDVIIQMDGKDVKNMNELNTMKYQHQIGDTVTLKINRDGKEMDLSLTLAEQP